MSQDKGCLGLWTATSMVTGNMIGSGIFLLPSALALYGSISIAGWIFSSLGSLTLAYVFANLAKYVRGSGGPYIYTRTAFGELLGFSVAWGYWICIIAANAAIAIALVSYLSVFIPGLKEQGIVTASTTLGLLWLLVAINLKGVKQAGKLQLTTTILKLIPLVFISLFGCFYLNVEHFVPWNLSGSSDISAISASAALTMWAFLGLESANNLYDEVKDPEKNVPKAALMGTVIAATVYILGSIAVMGLIEPDKLAKSSAPFADAAALLWGSWGYYLIGLCAVISCFGTLNGWTLCIGQIPMAAAKDGLFPKMFAEKSRNDVPVKGIVFSTILVSVLVLMNYNESLVSQFTFVILLSTFATVLPYLLCSFAHLYMSISNKTKLAYTPINNMLTLIAILFSCWIILNIGTDTIVLGMFLLLTGLPVFMWMKRKNKSLNAVDNITDENNL
ncbi:MAG: amino acid permease [Alteromonadaceae bacterium]|nr:amino acid permease [Alteromonadaceae bacterium]